MSLRDERKQQTRQALMDAALTLSSGGRGLSSVSLREVAREAGVVPTAFYRHFKNLDELGLALVDQVAQQLRQIMREARQYARGTDIAIQSSVRGYVYYVRTNTEPFEFIVRERLAGPPVVRDAIAREIRYFVGELASDVRNFPDFLRLPANDVEMIAHLVVHTVYHLAADILSLQREGTQMEEEIIARTVKQLRLIFLGAKQWRPERGAV
jgi:TetR/AcrR family transcriptional regulator, fatty acid biosynthesis regulator